MNSYGWVRHRSGGVGLRSERPGITGTMGPSTSWDQWPRPVTRAVVGAQECTQIDQNGLSAPFWGICVHCWAVGLGCGWPWDRNSVHKWEDRASPRRFGAFVYTVEPWRRCGQARGSQECTQIGQNGLSAPFWGICVHYWAARVARVVTQAASGGMSTPTTMACRRRPLSVATSPLVGKTGSARQALRKWRHRQVGVFPKRQPT